MQEFKSEKVKEGKSPDFYTLVLLYFCTFLMLISTAVIVLELRGGEVKQPTEERFAGYPAIKR